MQEVLKVVYPPPPGGLSYKRGGYARRKIRIKLRRLTGRGRLILPGRRPLFFISEVLYLKPKAIPL